MISEGSRMPAISLPGTDGHSVNLSRLAGISIVYAYPKTSPPDSPPIEGWDLIPGARGCTAQSCAFRDLSAELKAAGSAFVFGMSTQDTAYQAEAVRRLQLPFPLLSDSTPEMTNALGLPTFEAGGQRMIVRTTLLIEDGVVVKLISPVSDPGRNAEEVLSILSRRSA